MFVYLPIEKQFCTHDQFIDGMRHMFPHFVFEYFLDLDVDCPLLAGPLRRLAPALWSWAPKVQKSPILAKSQRRLHHHIVCKAQALHHCGVQLGVIVLQNSAERNASTNATPGKNIPCTRFYDRAVVPYSGINELPSCRTVLDAGCVRPLVVLRLFQQLRLYECFSTACVSTR